jgi:hypothetical protein
VPTLHVHPAELRAVAAALEALLPALRGPGLDAVTLAALARAPGGAALVAGHRRLAAAVARTDGELAALVAGLTTAATGVETADDDAVRTVGAVRW